MPPTISLEQMTGFGLFMLKAVLSGRGDEIVDLARSISSASHREEGKRPSRCKPTEALDMTTNPSESATDAVNRTAQEILAALLAKDSAKVTAYYAPDAVIATPGRPAARDGQAVSKVIRDDTEDPNFKMSLSNEKTEVAGSGELAYRRGHVQDHFHEPADHTGGEWRGHRRRPSSGSRRTEAGRWWKISEFSAARPD